MGEKAAITQNIRLLILSDKYIRPVQNVQIYVYKNVDLQIGFLQINCVSDSPLGGVRWVKMSNRSKLFDQKYVQYMYKYELVDKMPIQTFQK